MFFCLPDFPLPTGTGARLKEAKVNSASSSCTHLGQVLATNHVPGTSLDRNRERESGNEGPSHLRPPPPPPHPCAGPPRNAPERRPPCRLGRPSAASERPLPPETARSSRAARDKPVGRDKGHQRGRTSGCRPPRLSPAAATHCAVPSRTSHTRRPQPAGSAASRPGPPAGLPGRTPEGPRGGRSG